MFDQENLRFKKYAYNVLKSRHNCLTCTVVVWLGVVGLFMWGIHTKMDQLKIPSLESSPLQRIQFAKSFTHQQQWVQTIHPQLHTLWLEETYTELEHQIRHDFHNVTDARICRQIAKMFHPDQFMQIDENKPLYTDEDRQYVSSTHALLFDMCKQKNQPSTISDIASSKDFPFQFAFENVFTNTTQITDTHPFHNIGQTPVLPQSVLHLEYTGEDRMLGAFRMHSISCKQQCSIDTTLEWKCMDNFLPHYLTLRVEKVNCSLVEKKGVYTRVCLLKYNIYYTQWIDFLFCTTPGQVFLILTSVTLFGTLYCGSLSNVVFCHRH